MSYALSVVMNSSAALLNDPAKTDYTFAAQLPYLRIALLELQEQFELNNIPVTNETSAGITVDAGVKVIGFNTTPALPSDLIEIQQIWERLDGSSEPFIPMTRFEFLPHYLEGEPVSELIYWSWIKQELRFIGATTDREIKLDYISSLFSPNTADETTIITVINTQTFLTYRNAALCAEFIGENPSRAQALNVDAGMAMDRALGIPTKGKQSIAIRRRPFRAAYRTRSWIG